MKFVLSPTLAIQLHLCDVGVVISCQTIHVTCQAGLSSYVLSSAVFLLNLFNFGYFDPVNIFFGNKNTYFSGLT